MAQPAWRSGRDAAAEYCPEEDIAKVAGCLAQRYGSLEEAQKRLHSDTVFDLCGFEAQLRKWGVAVDNVVELFDHIDKDWSGTIDMFELFAVLALSLQAIQLRDEQVRRKTVNRIYAELGRRIRVKFGSIEDAFAKHGLPGAVYAEGGGALSVAGFRRLVHELGIELDAAQLHLAYNAIDDDKSGFVSLQELQGALSFHLVRDTLVDLADAIVEQHGSLAKPFEMHFRIQLPLAEDEPIQTQMDPVAIPHVPSETCRTMQPTITEEQLFRFLRRFGGGGPLIEAERQRLQDFVMRLHRQQPPLGFVHEFIRLLQQEHQQAIEDRRQESESAERGRKEHGRLFRQPTAGRDSRRQAAGDVAAWLTHVEATSKAENPAQNHREASCFQAAVKAVPGTAPRAQLQDYVYELQGHLSEKEEDVQKLQRRLIEKERELRGHFRLTPTSRNRSTYTAAFAGDATPCTPVSPSTPSCAAVGRSTRATRAEDFIQAASCGNADGVRRCLELRADIDTVAWGGITALMAAVSHGREDIVVNLVAWRADPMWTDAHGRTALDHARRQPQLGRLLRNHGCMTGRELVQQAELLARRLLETEREKSALQRKREQLPSASVSERVRSRNANLPPKIPCNVAQKKELASSPFFPEGYPEDHAQKQHEKSDEECSKELSKEQMWWRRGAMGGA